ncbi:M24 family metallopeptidase [Candidatus Peregrinibacteria bacterium]|nr:M24 family metallopeptidase [Candidatus Peregrinibacteria bacterium]
MKIESKNAFLVTNPSNVKYLTGFKGSNGQVLFTKSKKYFLTDARYIQFLKSLDKNFDGIIYSDFLKTITKILKKHKTNMLQLEGNHITYNQFQKIKSDLKPIKIIPNIMSIEKVRQVKKTHEIKLLQKAQQINEIVFKKVVKDLKNGITEIQIAETIKELAKKEGADDISFEPIAAFGENSANPHHENTKRKLKKGDVVLIDMGMKYKEYCSDMTRTLFTAKPNAKQKEVYNVVLQAQLAAEKALKAGKKGAEVDKTARTIMKDFQYEQFFTHSLGHGIGIDVHESPALSTKNDLPIPENAVVTIEPGIYLQKLFGVRIEDMVLVKRQKNINLTKVPKDIESLILNISN